METELHKCTLIDNSNTQFLIPLLNIKHVELYVKSHVHHTACSVKQSSVISVASEITCDVTVGSSCFWYKEHSDRRIFNNAINRCAGVTQGSAIGRLAVLDNNATWYAVKEVAAHLKYG